MSLYLEFDLLIRRFAAAHIRYAVAGGLAVGLHGFVRATEDMDFIVDSDDLEKVAGILRRAGYRRNPETVTFRKARFTLHRFYKRAQRAEDLLVVDVLIPISGPGQLLLNRAVKLRFADTAVHVVTNKDLIWMKKMRGSATDRADIERLTKPNE